MATIAQNLQKIIDSKAALKTAINAKGGNITNDTPLEDYADVVDSLSSGNTYCVPASNETVVEYGGMDGITSANSAACFLEEIIIPRSYTISNWEGNFLSGPEGFNCVTKKLTIPSGTYVISSTKFGGSLALEQVLGGPTASAVMPSSFYRDCAVNVFDVNLENSSTFGINCLAGLGCKVWYLDNTKAGLLGDVVLKDNATISQGAFNGANFNSIQVNSATIPGQSLAILGNTAIIGANCTTLNNQAFYYSGYLLKVNLKSGGFDSISGCNIKTLIMKGTTPPTLNGSFSLATLEHIYVPSSAVNTYKTATNWMNYESIIAADPNE